MKITASEIREKTFEKNFRGYDKDEVTAFMNSLSKEWERMVEENETLQKRLDLSEKEANKLKEVEESLFRTLKTAEDTGASIIEEANLASAEIMQEAHQNAEAMLNDAKNQSRNLIEAAESKGKQIMEDLKSDVNSLVKGYESLIQQRELIIKNLKKLAEDIGDNITVSQNDFKKVDIKAHLQVVEDLSKANAFTIANISKVNEGEAGLVKQNNLSAEAQTEPVGEEKISEKPENSLESEEVSGNENAENPEKVEEDDPAQSTAEHVDEQEEDTPKTAKGGSFFDEVS